MIWPHDLTPGSAAYLEMLPMTGAHIVAAEVAAEAVAAATKAGAAAVATPQAGTRGAAGAAGDTRAGAAAPLSSSWIAQAIRRAPPTAQPCCRCKYVLKYSSIISP